MAHLDFEALVGLRTGIITQVTQYEGGRGTAAGYRAYLAQVADTRQYSGGGSGWLADRTAWGATFFDDRQSRQAAIGEAIERYCGNFVPAGLMQASYYDLKQATRYPPPLDPDRLVLYSDQQYTTPGFPFRRFEPTLPVRWVHGTQLATGESVMLPASLVYLNYYNRFGPKEVRTNFVVFAGIACGQSFEQACLSALQELIERDALMLWWLGNGPTVRVAIDTDEQLGSVLADLNREMDDQLNFYFFQLPNEFNIPVLGVLLEDTRQGIVVMGSACRSTASSAAWKALAEAVQLYNYSCDLLDPDSLTWQAVRAGRVDPRCFKPYRADRKYLDYFEPEFRGVSDLAMQSQLYLDPRMHRYTDRITQATPDLTLADLVCIAQTDHRQVLDLYLGRLGARGFQALTADLTTPDVRMTGLHVVRLIVPGLYPNAPAGFPFLGGSRLYAESCRADGRISRLSSSQVVRVPLPYS